MMSIMGLNVESVEIVRILRGAGRNLAPFHPYEEMVVSQGDIVGISFCSPFHTPFIMARKFEVKKKHCGYVIPMSIFS